MEYEKKLKVIRDNEERVYTYFACKNDKSEFERETYNVGIICEDKICEIEDFSLSREDAVKFCEYLYEENVSVNHLFLIGEEFITENNI